MVSDRDITSHYLKYFCTLKASTSELKEQAYKIRYQVYFEEQKIISSQHLNNNYETDIWDSSAIHSLLFHRSTNQAIGNVRLIPLEKGANKILPIEQHYRKPFDFSATPITQLRDGKTGEVSRMAILPAFRRRLTDQNDSLGSIGYNDMADVCRFPINYMPMCLTFAAINLMIEECLDYGIALMEPRLARLLCRFGVILKQIGQPVDYFGFRAPYLIFPETTNQNISDDYRGLFDTIRQELSGS